MEQKPLTALQRAIDHFGSQVKFGAFIGRPQQTISDWVNAGTLLPPEYILAVAAETGIPSHDFLVPGNPAREPLPAGSHSAAAAPAPASLAPDAGEFSPPSPKPEAA